MSLADGNIGVLYSTTLHSSGSKVLLESVVTTFLAVAQGGVGKLLHNLYYEQEQTMNDGATDSLDLAFNDGMLEDVRKEWKSIIGDTDTEFMLFEDRAGTDADDDNDNEY